MTRTRQTTTEQARWEWEGFGPDDSSAPARSQTFSAFVVANHPHLDVEHDDPADDAAVASVTAAFGTVVEVREGFETVTNGFGGTTTRRGQSAPAATEPQKNYLRTLLAERAGTTAGEAIRSHLNTCRTSPGGLTKSQASDAIKALLAAPKAGAGAEAPAKAPQAPAERPKPAKAPNLYAGKCFLCGKRVESGAGLRSLTDEGKWAVEHDGGCPTAFPFPEGRYAVPAEDGTLRFYHLTDGVVFVQASSDLHPVPQPAAAGIVAKIALDPEAASRTYGREIGSCGRCGRVLTNDQSRSEGIGPICASKGF